ncbi:MAG: hypothetical protein AB7F88_04165 [Pyrinomonadaceae bacterium]
MTAPITPLSVRTKIYMVRLSNFGYDVSQHVIGIEVKLDNCDTV